jgi:threonine dehydratase
VCKTPLQYSERLSRLYNANIYYKREDLQITRSFKIRGATNKIKILAKSNLLQNGITCASAGNHAQGVAYICNKMNLDCRIYLPETTPLQKVNRIKYFGGDNINIVKFSNSVDDCLIESKKYSEENNYNFIHPFDDADIINGQATIAEEIYSELNPDMIICPVGGGGLISGISKYSKYKNKDINIIGVEPYGAASLYGALKKNKRITIENMDTFVDGAAVSTIGKNTFEICKKYVDNIELVKNEHLCYDLINAYQDDGIILEPAGCLSISALKNIHLNNSDDITNKNIVCILSGGNNDLTRYDEILDLSLKYQNLKHYFIVEFSQSPGQLKRFINNILGPFDDIIRFEYIKKTNRNYGRVLIGIELNYEENLENIIYNFSKFNFKFKKIDQNELL